VPTAALTPSARDGAGVLRAGTEGWASGRTKGWDGKNGVHRAERPDRDRRGPQCRFLPEVREQEAQELPGERDDTRLEVFPLRAHRLIRALALLVVHHEAPTDLEEHLAQVVIASLRYHLLSLPRAGCVGDDRRGVERTAQRQRHRLLAHDQYDPRAMERRCASDGSVGGVTRPRELHANVQLSFASKSDHAV
jgi:hypothetical protein